MNVKNEDLSDSDILAKVIEGDTNMFGLVMERYEAKLMRYASFLLKDYDIASDVVQETFIKVYVNLRSFNLSKPFSPWIYRILHNGAMNAIKSGKKICSLGVIDEIGDSFIEKFDTDKVIDKKMLDKKVRFCLGKISIKYQEVLGLSFFENLKYEEISDILHIPTSTVGVRIRRAKEALKKICQQEGVDYE
jgi:RNA polymerase sigma-70 factor (ECF subfamily)